MIVFFGLFRVSKAGSLITAPCSWKNLPEHIEGYSNYQPECLSWPSQSLESNVQKVAEEVINSRKPWRDYSFFFKESSEAFGAAATEKTYGMCTFRFQLWQSLGAGCRTSP